MKIIELSTGTRLSSAVCDAEVIVIKGPSTAVSLECGGVPMTPAPGTGERVPPKLTGESALIGKRYTDAESGLVVLCTKGGTGVLTADGRPMPLMATKRLPASD